MTDKAHFHPSRFVNKPSVRCWASENLQELHKKKTTLYSSKAIVWCGIAIFGTVGPYYFVAGDITWPSQSPSLSVPGSFLWGFLKDGD